MRWSVIKSLFLTNLLYVNPQKTNLQRVKVIKKKKNLQNRIFFTLMSANILGIIFVPLQFIFTNFSSIADKFMSNSFIFLFFIISIVMQTFYSIFYEDSLTKNLTALPVSDKEVFYSRVLTLLFYNFTLIYAFTAFNIIAHIKFYEFNLLSLFLVVVYSFSALILILVLAISFLVSITKIKFMRKYMQIIKFAISLFGGISVFVFLSSMLSALSENIALTKTSDYKGDFVFNIVARTLETNSIYSILLLVILAGLSLLILNTLVKNYLDNLNSQNKVERKQIITQNKNTDDSKNIFRKITVKSFSNGNLIRQSILSSLLLPVIFSNAIFQARDRGYFTNGFEILPTAIILAVVCTFIMITYASFPALAISIDFKNYEMLKTMPVNIKNYLLNKLYIALAFQLAIISIIYIIILIILDISFLVGLISYLVFLVVATTYLIHLFTKDLKTPFVGWTNIAQLANRGFIGGGFKAFIKFPLLIIAASIIIGANVLYTIFLPNYWYILSLIYIIIISIILVSMIKKLFTEIEKIQ